MGWWAKGLGGGPSIAAGVGSPVSLHRGSKAGPGWTLGGSRQSIGGVRALSETSCFGSLHGTPDNPPPAHPPSTHLKRSPLDRVFWFFFTFSSSRGEGNPMFKILGCRFYIILDAFWQYKIDIKRPSEGRIVTN